MKTIEPDDELSKLLGGLCDGSLTAEQSERINVLLKASREARQYYFDYLTIHGILAWDLSPADKGRIPGTDEVVPSECAPCESAEALLESIVALTATEGRRPAGRTIGVVNETVRLATEPRFSLALVAGIVAAACVATLAISRNMQTAAPEVVAEVAPETSAKQYVATLVGTTSGGKLSFPLGEARDGSRLPAGDIRLDHGVAEIMFDSGAKAILQGPARFTPQSNSRGILHFGRLVVSVPPQAGEFEVQTEVVSVTAKQDEFAIRADVGGPNEVHVFSGSAEVTSRRSGSQEVVHTKLTAGDAVRIEPDNRTEVISTLLARPDAFVRTIPSKELQFPPSLVGYWNFEEDGGPVLDLRGVNHGAVNGPKRCHGLIGRGAMEYGGTVGETVNIGRGDKEFYFSDGIAVEAVVAPRWKGAYGSFAEIFRKDDGEQRVLLCFQNDANQPYAIPKVPRGPVLAFGLNIGGKYSELDMPLDGKEGRPTFAEMTDGTPRHIVALYDSRSGEKAIFIDGKYRFGTQLKPGGKIVSGGLTPAFIGSASGWETFTGVIDEVAIYNLPLSPEEIMRHWKNVQARRSYFELPAEHKIDDSI